jgi:chromate transporter
VIGAIYASQRKATQKDINTDAKWEEKEKSYFINSLQPAAEKRSWGWVGLVLAICGLLWVWPYIFLTQSVNGSFWQPFILFFTKSALVTFGGAYSVLQYVAQVSVEKFGWLTSLQMVDGLALGESTPGPLIMVLAFVGFMAAYNYSGFSLGFGSLGLLVTVFYTFLPCFFFIFSGAPLIERTRNNSFVKAMLEIIKAAITGVLLSLAVYLFQQVLFLPTGDGFSFQFVHFGWFLISFAAIHFFKISLLKWLAVSVVFGGLLFLSQNHFPGLA